MIKSVYEKYKEIINYLIFGVLTTVISLIVYYGLTFTIINPDDALMLQVANVISWIAGVLFAYFTNRKYVFESKNENKYRHNNFALEREVKEKIEQDKNNQSKLVMLFKL